jgi:ferritin-like metal-binding protein YciE
MESKAFERLYLLQLQDIYSAGKQIVDALPRMIKSANNKDLKNLFKEHLEQVKLQVGRIENIFKKLKQSKTAAENCNVVEEFIEEIEDWLEESDHKLIIDAGLILIFKKISHYQIAVYESILSYARILGQEKMIELLQESLTEEYMANDRLDEICEEAGGILVNK